MNSPFKYVDVLPGSDEWRRWRHTGIGASDASVIMGTNPYKSPYQLWEEKIFKREEVSMNAAMKHGVIHEPKAREWVERTYFANFPATCMADEEDSYLLASLDGYDGIEDIVLEIKCPVSSNIWNQVKDYGVHPPYWLDQVQWQLMVSGAQKAYLAVYDSKTDHCVVHEIQPSSFRHYEMRKRAKEFWQMVIHEEPPTMGDKDYSIVSDSNLEQLVSEYGAAWENSKRLNDRLAKLKEKILALGPKHSFLCNGAKINYSKRVGHVDTKAMQADGIDIEAYRKDSYSIVSITYGTDPGES